MRKARRLLRTSARARSRETRASPDLPGHAGLTARRLVRSRVSRFIRPRLRAVAAASALATMACAPVQGGPADASGPEFSGPAIEGAATTPDPVAERLLRQASAALRDREYAAAQRATEQVIAEHPRAPGSAEALWILAQATYALDAFGTAAEASARYRGLLDPDDPRRADAAVLAARAYVEDDAHERAIGALLAIDGPARSGTVREADELARSAVRRVATDRLGELVTEEGGASPVLPIVRLEYAVGLYFRGQVDEAARIAREVLQGDLETSDRRVAQSLVTGDVEDVVGSGLALGAILPETGSPTLRGYARDIEEGIRVALDARARDLRRPVRLEILDDGGRDAGSRRSIQALEESGVLAVVGPLLDEGLRVAAEARSGELAILSPTAEAVPSAPGVYSLGAADPGAVNALADYAASAGLRRVVVVHADSEKGREEATAFVDAYTARGGSARRVSYAPGSTDFREQLQAAVDFEADGLVLPVPQGDIELIAPQVSRCSGRRPGPHPKCSSGSIRAT
jgi:TolA-binding protein